MTISTIVVKVRIIHRVSRPGIQRETNQKRTKGRYAARYTAPTKRELNGGILQVHSVAASSGRKNNKTPAAKTTEHSTASTSLKNRGTAGLFSDRSSTSGYLFHRHPTLLTGEETKINANHRL
jgi:hypothetical protein